MSHIKHNRVKSSIDLQKSPLLSAEKGSLNEHQRRHSGGYSSKPNSQPMFGTETVYFDNKRLSNSSIRQ